MELNSLIFPAPKPTYNESIDGIVWIPRCWPKIQSERTFIKQFNKISVKAKIVNNKPNQKENVSPEFPAEALDDYKSELKDSSK